MSLFDNYKKVADTTVDSVFSTKSKSGVETNNADSMKTELEIKAKLQDLQLMLDNMKKEGSTDAEILDVEARIVTLGWVLGYQSDVLN